jgi:hypothetical protein
MPWLRRFVNTIRSSRLQRDIDREIAFHIREREDELRANGLPADEARRRAVGNLATPRCNASAPATSTRPASSMRY